MMPTCAECNMDPLGPFQYLTPSLYPARVSRHHSFLTGSPVQKLLNHEERFYSTPGPACPKLDATCEAGVNGPALLLMVSDTAEQKARGRAGAPQKRYCRHMP